MKVVRCLLLFYIYSHTVFSEVENRLHWFFFQIERYTGANYRFESLETISFCSEIYYVDNEGTK